MKFRIFGIAALSIITSSNCSWAGTAAECLPLQDAAAKLKCFEEAAEGEKSATTKEIVAAPESGPAQLVDPEDAYVAPKKFISKYIEIRGASCFYADKDEYRCLAPGPTVLMLIAPNILPVNEREILETNCGQIKKISSPLCRRTVRLRPSLMDSDHPSPLISRVVLVAPTLELERETKKKRKR